MVVSYYSWNWYDPNSQSPDIKSELRIEFEKDFDAEAELTVTTNGTITDGTSNGYVTIITRIENISPNDKVGRWDDGANPTGQATNFWKPLQDERMVYFSTNVWNPFGNVKPMAGWGTAYLEFDDNAGCVKYLQTGNPADASNFLKTEYDCYWTGDVVSGYDLKIVWNAFLYEKAGYNTNNLAVDIGLAGTYSKWQVTLVDVILENTIFSSTQYTSSSFSVNTTQLMAQYRQLINYASYSEMYLTLRVRDVTTNKVSETVAVHFYSTIDQPSTHINLQLDTTTYNLPAEFMSNNAKDGSVIRFRNSPGTDDGGYNDRKDQIAGTVLNGTYGRGVSFTTTYALNQEQLGSIGGKIWEDEFAKNIFAVNTAPIENIVSVYKFPANVGSDDQEVYVGNFNTGVKGGVRINSGVIDVGEFVIKPIYSNFLDFSPYSRTMLYLPFLGLVDLPTSEMMGRKYLLRYVQDYVTGVARILLIYENTIFMEWECRTGIEIPISNQGLFYQDLQQINDMTQGLLGIANGSVSSTVSALSSALTTPSHVSTKGSASADCSSKSCVTAYLLRVYPQWQLPANYYHTVGGPCNLTRRIGTLTGFTKCAPGIDLKGIEKLTEPEKEELRVILESGFYA